jgi:hypothetical protein
MVRQLCALMIFSLAVVGGGQAQDTSPSQLEGSNLESLIGKLADDDFPLRQKAEDELHRLLHLTPAGQPNPVEEICLATFLATDEPEIRARVRSVLADFATNLWSPVGHLGLTTAPDSSYDAKGKATARLKITKVQPDTPAAAAGLKTNTFIMGVNATIFGSGNAKTIFADMLAARACGEKVTLHILDGEKTTPIAVALGFKARQPRRDNQGEEMAENPELCLREYFRVKKKRHPALAPVGGPPPRNSRYR